MDHQVFSRAPDEVWWRWRCLGALGGCEAFAAFFQAREPDTQFEIRPKWQGSPNEFEENEWDTTC